MDPEASYGGQERGEFEPEMSYPTEPVTPVDSQVPLNMPVITADDLAEEESKQAAKPKPEMTPSTLQRLTAEALAQLPRDPESSAMEEEQATAATLGEDHSAFTHGTHAPLTTNHSENDKKEAEKGEEITSTSMPDPETAAPPVKDPLYVLPEGPSPARGAEEAAGPPPPMPDPAPEAVPPPPESQPSSHAFPKILHKPKAEAVAEFTRQLQEEESKGGLEASSSLPHDASLEKAAATEPPAPGFEADLLHELQEIVARDCGGSAKLLVAGGFGASQGKKSVFRMWQSVLDRHEAQGLSSSDPVDPALFEQVLGGDYLLQDLHVLDLASLQWSEPVPKDPMPQPRAGHAASIIPVKVTLPLPGSQPTAKVGGADSDPMTSRDIDVASLMRSMSAYVAELQQAVSTGERETIGKFLFECFLSSLRRSLMTHSTKGLLSQPLTSALLELMLGDRPQLKETATKIMANRLKGKQVDLIHVEDLHASLMATKGAMDHLVDVFVNARNAAMPLGGAYAVSVKAEVTELKPISPHPDYLILTVALESATVPEASGPRVAMKDLDPAKLTATEPGAPNRSQLFVEQSWPLGVGSDPETVRSFLDIANGNAPSSLLIKLQAYKTGVRLPGQKDDAAFTVAHCRVDLRTMPSDLLNKELVMTGVKKEPLAKVRLSVTALSALRSLQKRGQKNAVEAFRLMLTYGKTLGGRKQGSVDENAESSRIVEPAGPPSVYDAVANTWREVRLKATDYEAVPRTQHSATRTGRHVLVFGGLASNGEALARLEAIDLQDNSVRALTPSGAGPSARAGHSAVFIEAPANPASLSPGSVVFFGGSDGSGSLYTDTHVLKLGNDLLSSKWDMPSLSGDRIRGRCNHSACAIRSKGSWRMYVFGGRVFSDEHPGKFEVTNTLLCLRPMPDRGFSTSDLEWEQVECHGPLPPPRELCTMQAVGNKVMMCGGWLGLHQAPWIRDFWILDTERNGWVSLVFEDRWPSARFAHSSALVDYRSTSLRHCTLHCLAMVDDGGALRIESEAGKLIEIEVNARDANGLLVDRGGDCFLAIIRPASKAMPGPLIHPTVEDLGWGRYRMTFCLTRAGDFVLSVTDELGNAVGSGPLHLSIRPGPMAPGRSLVLAPTIGDTAAGEECRFSLIPHDMFGNRVPASSVAIDQVAVTLGGPDQLRPRVTHNPERETLDSAFVPTKSGKYMMTVKVGGFHVDGSPFRVNVRAAKADIRKFAVTGKVLQGNRWFSGTQAMVMVAARDRFGNRNFEGGDEIMLGVGTESGEFLPVTVEPNPGDGTYKCYFTPQKLGPYSVTCLVRAEPGVAAEGCPFFFKVSNSHLDMSKVEVSGEGFEGKANRAPGTLVAGEEVSMTIVAKDEQGNRMEGGNDHFVVWLERKDGRQGRVMAAITDHGDGTYTATFTPREEGTMLLHVEGASGHKERADYKPHPLCPKEMSVHSSATEPSLCMASGPGVLWVSTVGQATSFTVTANDKHGNRRRTGGDLVEATVEGETSYPTSIKDNKDGTYTVTYRPQIDRKKFKNMVFKVTVNINGKPIWGSPFFQRVAVSRASPSGSYFENAPDRMTAGKPVQFFLISCDPDRKPLIAGGEDFRLSVSGNPSAHGELKDMRDGRYLIRLLAEELDSYHIQVAVTLHGEVVGGKPLDILVVPEGLFNVGFWAGAKQVDEALASQFLITGAGSESAIAGERAAFEIVAKRLDDLAPASAFAGELRGPENIPVTITGPFEGGIYKCHYVATKSGHYNGIVKIGRVPLPGSPLQLFIEGDTTEPAMCEVAGLGLSECVAGQEASFRIAAKDQHGNPSRDNGRDFWRVAIVGGKLQKVVGSRTGKFKAAMTEAKVFNNKDSTYTAKYILPMEGAFSLDIFHSTSQYGPWTIVGKSPYSIVCRRAPEDEQENAKAALPAVDTVDAEEMKRIGAQQVAAAVMAEAARATAASTGDIEKALRVKTSHAMSMRYRQGEVTSALASVQSADKSGLVPTQKRASIQDPKDALRAELSSPSRIARKSLGPRTSGLDPSNGSLHDPNKFTQEVWKKDGLLALGTWGQRDTIEKVEKAWNTKEEKSKTQDNLQLAVEELASAGALQKRSMQLEMLSRISTLASKKEQERRRSLTDKKSAKSQKFMLPPI